MEDGFLKEEDLEPEIGGLGFYLDAFRELATTRQIGLGSGPIPFTAIVEYTRIFEVPDFDDFLYVIRRVEDVYTELEEQERKSKEKSAKGSRGSSGTI